MTSQNLYGMKLEYGPKVSVSVVGHDAGRGAVPKLPARTRMHTRPAVLQPTAYPHGLYLRLMASGRAHKERINRWQRQYWRERTKYIPPPSRDWPKGWRTERKMRDIHARLELYDYGGRINVPRMMKTTARRELEAWIDERWISGINWWQKHWAAQAPTQQSERGPRLLHGETRAARYGSRVHISTTQPTTQSPPNWPKLPR
jgi:hypothetical protein